MKKRYRGAERLVPEDLASPPVVSRAHANALVEVLELPLMRMLRAGEALVRQYLSVRHAGLCVVQAASFCVAHLHDDDTHVIEYIYCSVPVVLLGPISEAVLALGVWALRSG